MEEALTAKQMFTSASKQRQFQFILEAAAPKGDVTIATRDFPATVQQAFRDLNGNPKMTKVDGQDKMAMIGKFQFNKVWFKMSAFCEML